MACGARDGRAAMAARGAAGRGGPGAWRDMKSVALRLFHAVYVSGLSVMSELCQCQNVNSLRFSAWSGEERREREKGERGRQSPM